MAPMWLLTVDISSETDEPFACGSGVLSLSSPAEPGTRCSLNGSCHRIAQRSWAFRRRGPADPAVRPALHLGAHAVSPARLQRVESLRCSGQSAPPTYTPTSRREALKGHRSRSLGLNRCGTDDELKLAVGVAQRGFDCFRRLSLRDQE